MGEDPQRGQLGPRSTVAAMGPSTGGAWASLPRPLPQAWLRSSEKSPASSRRRQRTEEGSETHSRMGPHRPQTPRLQAHSERKESGPPSLTKAPEEAPRCTSYPPAPWGSSGAEAGVGVSSPAPGEGGGKQEEQGLGRCLSCPRRQHTWLGSRQPGPQTGPGRTGRASRRASGCCPPHLLPGPALRGTGPVQSPHRLQPHFFFLDRREGSEIGLKPKSFSS